MTTDSTLARDAEFVRANTLGISVRFTWLGLTRKVTTAQQREVDESFHALPGSSRLVKTLINTRNPHYRALTRLRSRMRGLWDAAGLPWVEPGVRLVKNDKLDSFRSEYADLQGQFLLAEHAFSNRWREVLDEAQDRLGRLFAANDYPPTAEGLFVAHDPEVVNLEPPDYLRFLSPSLYEEAQARAARQFEQAVALYEEQAAEEFRRLTAHLAEVLTPGEDGRPRRFQASTVDNAVSFLEAFRARGVRQGTELDALVTRAESLLQGVDAEQLRLNGGLRTAVQEGMARVVAALDGSGVRAQPRRMVARRRNRTQEQPNVPAEEVRHPA